VKRNVRKMEAGIKLFLEGFGVSMGDPDFRNTPHRVAKLYVEMFTPKRMHRIVSFPSTYTGMITLRHHTVWTMCPHHLLPVEMDVCIGYIPSKKVLGLSKLARVAEAVNIKPMKQEEYTDAVAFELHQLADPKGVGVIVAGKHGCMRCRGVTTRGDVVTDVMRGQFLMNGDTRHEFLELCRRQS